MATRSTWSTCRPRLPSRSGFGCYASNSPERGEPLYSEAGDALAAMIGEGPVRLESERPGIPERGSYGRLLAYLYVDGKNLNVEPVRQGVSVHYTRYGRGRFAGQFDAAEQEAKASGRGIWGNND